MEEKSCMKERSIPDGARLLSIIGRLNEQNGFQGSSGHSGGKNAVGFMCQHSQSSTRIGHQTSVMARRKRKSLGDKLHKCDGDKKVDVNAAGSEQAMGPRLLKNMKSEIQRTMEESIAEKQSIKTDDLPGSYGSCGIRSMDSSFSKKIKFTLEVQNAREDARPVVCLCKPTNSLSQKSKAEILKPKQHSSFSTDNSLSGNNTDNNNVDQKCKEGSSFNACKGSTIFPGSNRTRCCKGFCICGICLQQFSSALFLEKHRRQSKHYLCSDCGEDFNDRAIFEEHVLNKKCKTRSCCVCRKNFVLVGNLKEAASERRFRCPECQKLFENAEESSTEKDTGSSGGDPYRCMECGKTFLVLSRYKTHMMAAHTGERPFVCPQCGKGFARMYALSTHMKYTHSDDKKFKCEFCTKTFKRKDHLKSHEVTHLSKKPHCCEVCGQGFNQKISLRKHLPCSNTKPTETKATKDTEKKSTSAEKKSSERWPSNEAQMNSENYAEPNCTIPRNATKEYLGCRCPPSCACKKFTIAVNVSCENSSNDFREIASLPCCCDIPLDEAVSRTTDDI